MIVHTARHAVLMLAAVLLAACSAAAPAAKPSSGDAAPSTAWQQVLDAAKAEGTLSRLPQPLSRRGRYEGSR